MGKELIIKGADFSINALESKTRIWVDITSEFVSSQMSQGYYGYGRDGRTNLDNPGTQSLNFVKSYWSNTDLINSVLKTIRVTIPEGYTWRLVACVDSLYQTLSRPDSYLRGDQNVGPILLDENDILTLTSGFKFWGFNVGKNGNTQQNPIIFTIETLVSAGFKVEELQTIE